MKNELDYSDGSSNKFTVHSPENDIPPINMAGSMHYMDSRSKSKTILPKVVIEDSQDVDCYDVDTENDDIAWNASHTQPETVTQSTDHRKAVSRSSMSNAEFDVRIQGEQIYIGGCWGYIDLSSAVQYRTRIAPDRSKPLYITETIPLSFSLHANSTELESYVPYMV